MLTFKRANDYKTYLAIKATLSIQFELIRRVHGDYSRTELLDMFNDAAQFVVADNAASKGLDTEYVDTASVFSLAYELNELRKDGASETELVKTELEERGSEGIIPEIEIFIAEAKKNLSNEVTSFNPKDDDGTIYH